MDSLVVPGLDTLRRWLDEIGISFFECDSCQALHLPHMQNFDGIFDAKIDLLDNVVFIDQGSIIEHGDIDEVRERHRTEGKLPNLTEVLMDLTLTPTQRDQFLKGESL